MSHVIAKENFVGGFFQWPPGLEMTKNITLAFFLIVIPGYDLSDNLIHNVRKFFQQILGSSTI